VAKLRDRISVSKRARQKYDFDRFDLKELNDVEIKEKYQVEITSICIFRGTNDSFDINNAWEIITDHIKTAKNNLGYHRL
jgi:hypothetical protein